jgi:hypothetical protein
MPFIEVSCVVRDEWSPGPSVSGPSITAGVRPQFNMGW